MSKKRRIKQQGNTYKISTTTEITTVTRLTPAQIIEIRNFANRAQARAIELWIEVNMNGGLSLEDASELMTAQAQGNA